MRQNKIRSSRRLLINALNLSRRRFLTRVGWAGTAGYITSSSALVANWLPGSFALARELIVLDDDETTAMLAMARRLYPHDFLGDEYYWVVVKGVDNEMAVDPEFRARIKGGFADMKAAAGVKFSELGIAEQIAALQRVENTPFFIEMLEKTTFYFYNNTEVWPYFGYEGASWKKGGYINRGFDDADWIPDS